MDYAANLKKAYRKLDLFADGPKRDTLFQALHWMTPEIAALASALFTAERKGELSTGLGLGALPPLYIILAAQLAYADDSENATLVRTLDAARASRLTQGGPPDTRIDVV